jgi:mandelamide amidase
VAARIVPAALGGDTVGSIRVPASLCGVVGFKPTPGRWPSDGAFPISPTLDTGGVLARSVADCLLVDTVVARGNSPRPAGRAGLKGVRLAHAPRQHLAGVDTVMEAVFRETLRTLADAGAELVEVDLGADFNALAEQVTWPIFFHETLPAIRAFVAAHGVPASFEQIHEGLGPHFKGAWSGYVAPGAAGFVPEEAYRAVMRTHRPELQRRYADIVFAQADALLLPTTPCAAPTIVDQFKFEVAGQEVTDLFLSRNTYPASGAGLPGISIPMGLTPGRLPLGLELEAAAGADRDLLALAQRIEQVLGAAALR